MPPSGPTRDNHGVRLSERLLLILAPAAALASLDLLVKDMLPTAAWAFHHRSNALGRRLDRRFCWLQARSASFASRAVAFAGGVMSAGVLGNLVSARADGNWVPNPLTISSGDYSLAFDLSDVFFLLGNLLLMTALIVLTVRHRGQFAPPRQWERALARRLRP